MIISKTWRARLATLAVSALVLAACGGDDDDDAAPGAEATEETADASDDQNNDDQNTDDQNTDDNNADNDDEGSVEVDDLGDLPDECVDAVGDWLEKLEPIVEDIDWENASLEEMASLDDELSSSEFEMDEELEERCSRFTMAEGADMDALKELAEDRAPGVLGFLTFLGNMQDELADMTIPEFSIPDASLPDISMPDISLPDVSIPEMSLPADAPKTCEEAIAFIEGLIEQSESMMDLTLNDMTAFGTASTVLTTECSLEQTSEFYGRPEVSDWMSGT
jgi:hypothetical protein